MKKFAFSVLILAAFCGGSVSMAQSVAQTPYYCDFEDSVSAAGWVLTNGTQSSQWCIGSAVNNTPGGARCLYISADSGATHISLASAVAVSLGIAIQNVPEGAIISMPMRAAGNSRWRSFLLGSLSGAVEPVGAIAVLLLASLLMPVLPYMLAFAAGAMFYVVVEELIPEASSGQHSNLSTIDFAIGFVLMMVLDVVMG